MRQTTCPYCGVGCGVLAGAGGVAGDASHPANFGRLCAKGARLAETLDTDALYPVVDGSRVSWDIALDRVATGFQRIIAESGPDAVAFYVSGQLLTEDYYVANKLMKGFIGSANIDTNSRLCMSSAVAAQRRAFGADAVPVCYEDVELADLVVITGSNLAWAHPVLYQRLAAAKKARPAMRVVVIDPRRTATCEIADLHLAIAPGSDAFLFNALLHHLHCENALDPDYAAAHVEGYAAALAAAGKTGSTPARLCGIPASQLNEFFSLFANTRRTVTIFSQGINQSSSGVDKANAIINVHLATGRIGQPGMGPFSITGQPNAMGGREVGGLANQLAAHMDFSDEASIGRVARFWNAPNIAKAPGLKAVEMFDAIASKKIRAVWIIGTNPAVSMPDADRVREALMSCELVVVSDCVGHTDTTACADILLPAQGWGEKDGTVTNSERRISRQRAFLPPWGLRRADWWIICEVAKRMGYQAGFSYRNAAEIFREHASLSGFENGGRRAFDISGLSKLDDSQYDQLQPVQWPVNADAPGGTARLFEDGRFYTLDGCAKMVAVAPKKPAVAADENFPMVMNTGRMRDQWHTMTRTGRAPRLNSHSVEPFVQIHASDAQHLDDGGLARIVSRHGSMLARVQKSADQRRGSVFVPMHWSDAFARSARVDVLVAPITDPISGQPESKHTPVRVEPYRPAWQGFALSRNRLELTDASYCAATRQDHCWRHEIAGEVQPGDWRAWVQSASGIEDQPGDWRAWVQSASGIEDQPVEYQDVETGLYRAAFVREGRLETVFFIASDQRLPEREWLAGLFGREHLDAEDLAVLLSARPPQDAGRMLCGCFCVGENEIADAIRAQNLQTVEEVGRALKAGTGCGSCVPEIRRLLGRG